MRVPPFLRTLPLLIVGVDGAAARAEQPLVVATPKGLVELDADGKVLRSIARTRATHPRFVSGTHDLAFLARDGAELHLVSLDSGVEKLVAKLPRTFKSCGEMADYPRGHRFKLGDLAVQSDADISVANGQVCMVLQDRNDNMMNFQAVVRVVLATGAVSKLSVGCPGPPEGDETCPAVESGASQLGGEPTPEWPYQVKEGRLLQLGVTARPPRRIDRALNEEMQSPSGRWVVVSALTEDQGDYVYRRLFLLDRKTGALFPVRARAWPGALKPSQVRKVESVGDGTLTVAGEDPLLWLPGDRLRANNLLVTPGKGAIVIEGDLAQ